MAQTLLQVQRQIETLRETEAKLKKAEAAGVIARMKEAINAYGFTPRDLFGSSAVSSVSAKSRKTDSPVKTTKARLSQKAQYADGTGNEWVGRGPRPHWLRAELAAGKSLADFAIKGSKAKSSGAAPAEKVAPAKVSKKPKKKQVLSVKYRDDAGNSWTGRGWKPLWLKTAIESGKNLEDFAV